jgi:nucleoside phosphorylase
MTSMIQPSQADFALVTINDSEEQAVRDVFPEACLNRMPKERGVFSWWQMKGQAPSDRYVVIHASTGDAKGPLPAIEVIRELDRLFKPRFLFVLGTAGGIRERGIEYGRVVFSRQVHAGYIQLLDASEQRDSGCMVDIRLYDDPVQPPSDRLYLHAKSAAVGWQPTKLMEDVAAKADEALGRCGEHPWVKDAIESFKRTKAYRPEATEIFSGSYLIDGRNSELFASLKSSFPKVGAVEMEAGAVAQAVWHSIETERFVGYLVVKGISDVVDSDVPAGGRKAVRRALAQFASIASAEFAKYMIETWTGNTDQLYSRISLVPPKYVACFNQELGAKRHSNSVVYEGVTLDQYSRLLEHLCRKEYGVTSAWTFCYLAPFRFFAALEPSDEDDAPHQDALRAAEGILSKFKNDKESLRQKLVDKFPHFRVFSSLISRNEEEKDGEGKVIRLVHKGPRWEQNNKFLEDFAWLNGRVKCHVLDDRDLEGEDWVHRDQVVLNDELLFDFDQDEKRLVVTYLDSEGLGAQFRRFKEHCRSKCRKENALKSFLASADPPGPPCGAEISDLENAVMIGRVNVPPLEA